MAPSATAALWPKARKSFATPLTLPETVDPAAGAVMVEEVDFGLNVAVTVVFAFASKVQVPTPLQVPLQPAKVEPAAAAAVRVTVLPLVKLADQVDPQAMPVGALVTVSLPAPGFVTDSA
jgi:hypothetical protein